MLAAALALTLMPAQLLVFEGGTGPGRGRHVVLLAGDEEYRSEEALPQLAKILAKRHGFKCTVVFSRNEQGEIDPTVTTHQPGIEQLRTADLCIMLLRFRCWPDDQMRPFVQYLESGKPILALRTSTHAFNYPPESDSPYRRFHWQSTEWPGGFGRQVLGETWISHWGVHGKQATLALPVQPKHPILHSVNEVFGTTDVYEAAPPADSQVLMVGKVLEGMSRTDLPATGRKKTARGREQDLNEPPMPILWERKVKNSAGTVNHVITTTMGAATDLLDESLRRVLANSSYYLTGLPVPAKADVGLVGEYRPSAFGFGGYRRGVKPLDLADKD